MDRSLGAYETIAYLSGKTESQNFCVYLELDHIINQHTYEQALIAVAKQHEILQMTIMNGKLVGVNTNYELIYFPELNIQLNQLLENELNYVFNNLLWRATLVHNQTSSILTFTFHHTIADAKSVFCFVNDIFRNLLENKIPNYQALTVPAEQYFNITHYIKDLAFSEEEQPQKKPVNQQFIHFYLEQQQIEKITLFCKSNKISIHALLCTVFAESLHYAYPHQSRINCASPINLRQFIMEISERNLGYYLSRFDYNFDFKNRNNLADLAVAFYADYKDSLKSKAIFHLQSLSLIIEVINQYGLNAFNFLKNDRPMVLVSNCARLQLDIKGFNIKNFGFCVNADALLPNASSALLTCTTLENRMSLNFHFPRHFETVPQKIVHNFYMQLTKLIS